MWATVRSYCPQCGARAEQGDRFCRRCGAELDAPAPPSPPPPPRRQPEPRQPEPAPARGPRTRWFYIGALVVVAAGVGVALIAAPSHKADRVAATAPPQRHIGATARPAPPADPSLCTTRKIDPLDPRGRPGRCHTSDGTHVVVARQGRTLRMHSMDVRLVSTREADSVGTADGYVTQNAHGTFVVVTVALTSRLDSPAQVDPAGDSQTALVLDNGKRYDESFDAQDLADENAFFARAVRLQPDETASGDFVFDLPAKALRRFTRRGGSLVVAELGDDVGSSARYGVLHLGPP